MAAHILTSLTGAKLDLCPIRRALLSVNDKTDLIDLATFLASQGVDLLSTGGTAKAIRDAGLPVTDISDYTGSPEILDGRVKTLHPMVHGGLLAVRGNEVHETEMASNGIKPIDLVVINLYPFGATVASGAGIESCIENIDIGGPSMLRSSAKNHAYVTVVSSPKQYPSLIAEMSSNNASTTLDTRRRFATQAFALTAAYDTAISKYLSGQFDEPIVSAGTVTRTYSPQVTLKYGCNPHQSPAAIHSIEGNPLPFKVLNGTPGYINLLDALNAWQLVHELKQALSLPAAASFKHVSPAGAGLGIPLSEDEAQAYEVADPSSLSPVALAYIRARNADPLCSFGDFVSISDVVDLSTALVLKTEVSDGIIAPGFEPEALEILKAKKKGAFIILQADESFTPPREEYREVFGTGFSQRRNDKLFTRELLDRIVTAKESALSEDAVRDMILASISIKYTQSNSVGYAANGQMIGVGAGQQSRVDCVKLAGRKVSVWYLRQHPKVKSLRFRPGVKKQERISARVRYIEGDITAVERLVWEANFEEPPEPLTESEKLEFLATLSGVSLASDAFFPFRDSIDHASKYGVTYVAQPGGSVCDEEVVTACNEYGMSMAFTGLRLFHH